jgi:hypothetical protein
MFRKIPFYTDKIVPIGMAKYAFFCACITILISFSLFALNLSWLDISKTVIFGGICIVETMVAIALAFYVTLLLFVSNNSRIFSKLEYKRLIKCVAFFVVIFMLLAMHKTTYINEAASYSSAGVKAAYLFGYFSSYILIWLLLALIIWFLSSIVLWFYMKNN